MTDTTAIPGLRFGLILWTAGMVGSAVTTAKVLPQFLADLQVPLPAPLWLISLAGLAQSALLLALAVWTGVRLAPSVGLRAPAFEAVATGRPTVPVLRSQLGSGLIGGVLGGIVLFAAFRYAPGAVAEAQDRFTIPIAARVLYGGVTEELLQRIFHGRDRHDTRLTLLVGSVLLPARGPAQPGHVGISSCP